MRSWPALLLLGFILAACTIQNQPGEPPAATLAPTIPVAPTPAPSSDPRVPTTRLREAPTASWASFTLSTTLTLTSSAEIKALVWSPDGTALLYHTLGSAYLLDLRTGQSTALNIPARHYAWSPDGRLVGFVNRDTQTFDTYDRASGMLTQGSDIGVISEAIDWVDWSADSSISIATQRHIYTLDQTKSAQHAAVQVKASFSSPARPPDSPALRVAWSLAGDHLVAMARAPKQTAFFSGTQAQTTLPAVYELGVWSPDGALVVLTDINHTLDFYDSAGTLRERVSSGRNIRPLAWIDSDRLIYTRNNAGSSPHNAYMLRRGSSEALLINEELPDGTAVMEAVMAPTGMYLAYTTLPTSGYWLVVRRLNPR